MRHVARRSSDESLSKWRFDCRNTLDEERLGAERLKTFVRAGLLRRLRSTVEISKNRLRSAIFFSLSCFSFQNLAIKCIKLIDDRASHSVDIIAVIIAEQRSG